MTSIFSVPSAYCQLTLSHFVSAVNFNRPELGSSRNLNLRVTPEFFL